MVKHGVRTAWRRCFGILRACAGSALALRRAGEALPTFNVRGASIKQPAGTAIICAGLSRWSAIETRLGHTAAGQRIAATAIDGGVLFEDFDRCLGYFIPDCRLSAAEIMRRYDANEGTLNSPPSLADDFAAVRALRDTLTALAVNIPAA